MKTNWPTKKLGVVCDINGGNVAPQDYAVFSSDGIPFVRMQDLGRYHITDNLTATRDKIKREAIDKLGIKIFSRGSIILPRSGSVFANHRAILGIDAAVVSHIAILNNFKRIEPKYLFWYLTILDIGRHAVKTSNVDSISFQRLKNFEIPLPPLQIQKQIVERLDKIAEAQKLNDGLIQKTDELFQSLLHKELNPAGKDWEVKDIGEVCKIVGGGTPSREDLKHFKGDIPWVTVKDLHILEIEDTIEHINKESLKNSAANLVPADTILVATRVGLGKIAIAKKPLTFNQDIKGLIANDGVDASYLFYAILKNANEIVKNGKGATVKGVTQEFLKSIKIPLPPLKTQKQIVAKLSAVQDYKKQLLGQKAKLKELFDSVLSKSMNG